MRFRTISTLAVAMALLGGIGGSAVAGNAPVAKGNGNDPILKWNDIAVKAVVEDHSGTYGPAEQGGPTRGSYALAIVHIAMFNAANEILGGYEPYLGFASGEPTSGASVEAAVAQAAHDTLIVLYPSQTEVMDFELARALRGIQRGRDEGVAIGEAAADNILAARVGDGGDAPDVPFAGDPMPVPGDHQPDPLNPGQGLHVPEWGKVDPFGVADAILHNVDPPPALTSSEYTDAYNEVFALGGDGVITPTIRTAEQTEIGLFWGYDGSIGLGVPPCLYNQIARVIAQKERNSVMENARLFGLVNIAMADAGIASWYSKYDHNFWRPVIAIRVGDADGNDDTVGDPDWTPLGAPASNESNGGVDFTPPFPAYTSGHATFGAAMFTTLALFYGTDAYDFQIRSDELHGATNDSQGNNRHTVVRQFSSFSQAAEENARSRIYLGIHWSFDATAGVEQGTGIAAEVFLNVLNEAD